MCKLAATIHWLNIYSMMRQRNANMWPISRIIAALVLIRVVLLAVRIDLLFTSPWYSDFLHFFLLAKQIDRGLLPFVHYWVEYPPIFPLLSTGIYLLSAAGATGWGIGLPFYSIIGLMLIVAEVGVFVLIYKLSGLLWESPTPLYSLTLYGLLFVPYYLWSGSFDTLPTFLLLAGLWLLLTGSTRASAVAAALGFCTKLFPVVLLPIALCSIAGWQKKLSYLVTFSLTAAVILLPFALINPEMALASLHVLWSRPPWETVWALVQGVYEPGFIGPLSAHTDPHFWVPSAQPGTDSRWITLVFAALLLTFCWQFWNTRDRYKVVAGAGFVLCFLMLYSKGYSPQYLGWLAPLIVILWPNRFGAIYLVILGVANLIEAPLYLGFLPEWPGLLFVAVTIRTICLSVVALHCLYSSVGFGSLTRTLPIALRRLAE
jgi:hypothetical protein